MTTPRVDFDAYLDYMRRDEENPGYALHLGCRLTPAGLGLAAEKALQLKAEIEAEQ